jgi:subtilisin family serine protease
MKRIINLGLILVLVLAMFTGISFASETGNSTQNQSGEVHEYVAGELIVTVEPRENQSIKNNGKGSLRSEEAKLKNKGFKVVSSLHSEDEVSEQGFSDSFNAEVIDTMGLVYLVEFSQDQYKSINKAKQEIRKELKALGFKVKNVQENYVMHALEDSSTQDDVTIQAMHPNQAWHYNMINAPQAWNVNGGSSSVRIAVLDTGIDHNHPSLRNFVNTSLGRNYSSSGSSTDTMDRQGHGTHVAGTIASYGNVSGVMTNATLIPVKVLGDNGSGSSYGIQQGILYASSIGADVINMSLGGGGYDQASADANQTAVNRGTIVVAASGNDGQGSISYPAAYSSVIAVGSVTSSGTRSSFSNYGSGLDLVAPGSSIYSTWPNSGYNTISGTSMATPHVAGVAGLIRSVNSNISVANAKNILKSTAQYAGSATYYGSGIVDAYASVIAAGGGGTPPPSTSTSTDVSTNYSWYYRGETIHISSQVTSGGQALSNATVQFTITRPNGTTVTNSATTNSSGVATWSIGSSSSTATGTYQVKAVASKSGYTSSSDITSFSMY